MVILFLFLLLVFALPSCRNVEPEPAAAPEIVEVSVSELSFDAAVLVAVVKNGDGMVRCGFTITKEDGDPTEVEGSVKDGILFSARVETLEDGTLYHYSAFVDNGRALRVESPVKTFTTTERVPEILSFSATDVTYETALLSATVQHADRVTGCGFRISVEGSDVYQTIPAEIVGNSFSRVVTGLQDNCTYNYSAYIAYGKDQELLSEQKTFKTAQFVPVTIPELSYAILTLCTSYNAELMAKTKNIEHPQEVGFVVAFPDGNLPRKYVCVFNEDSFRLSLSGLTGNTRYAYYAYVILEGGVRLQTDPKDFTTPPDPENAALADASLYIEDPIVLKSLLPNWDRNRDGRIDRNEARQGGRIDLEGDQVSSLLGIDFITGAFSLSAPGTRDETGCHGQIVYCDVSRFTLLESVTLSNNHLADIVLNPTTHDLILDHNELRSITIPEGMDFCFSMNLSHNHLNRIDLRPVKSFTSSLDVSYNPCTELLVEAGSLPSLNCSNTLISKLDLRKTPVRALDCRNCSQLDTILLTKDHIIEDFLHDPKVTILYQ